MCGCLSSYQAFLPAFACSDLSILGDDLWRKPNRCVLGPTEEELAALRTLSLDIATGCFFLIAQCHSQYHILRQIH